MELITKVIKPDKAATPEFGEILHAGEFLSRVDIHTVDLEEFDTRARHHNRLVQAESPATYDGFNGFREVGVDAGVLVDQVVYKCPWSNNRYHWMYPLGVVTTDEWQYGRDRDNIRKHPELCRVINQQTDMENIDPLVTIPKITHAMMGHGFTTGTLPCDGSGKKVIATIPLDNGDELLVVCWIWRNK